LVGDWVLSGAVVTKQRGVIVGGSYGFVQAAGERAAMRRVTAVIRRCPYRRSTIY
jgi:hypothetical protein